MQVEKMVKRVADQKTKMQKYHAKNRKYKPWVFYYHSAKQRCNNPKHNRYKYYGGRGIEFKLTLDDVMELYFRYKAGFMIKPSLDRIDNNGNYTKNNCRFLELSENSAKESKKPVMHIETKETYTSQGEASRKTNYAQSTICRHCNGVVKNPKWVFVRRD